MPMHGQDWLPEKPAELCRKCGFKLADLLIQEGFEFHPTCDPVWEETQRRNERLRDKLMEVILWADEHSARSQQIEIGPSEMGSPCDARIGRILAGFPKINFRPDPWAAIVGTSIHTWMEQAVQRYKQHAGDAAVAAWETEVAMMIDSMIPAHSDLWDGMDVIDYKSAGPDVMRKMVSHGPPDGYKIQAHLYGYGQERRGKQVRDVVLVFLPRAGWLKDMFIWRETYSRAIAEEAIARTYRIGQNLIDLEVMEKPENWALVPRDTTSCWYCPYFANRPAEQGPDDTGCPGHNPPKEEREARSAARFDKGLLG